MNVREADILGFLDVVKFDHDLVAPLPAVDLERLKGISRSQLLADIGEGITLRVEELDLEERCHFLLRDMD